MDPSIYHSILLLLHSNLYKMLFHKLSLSCIKLIGFVWIGDVLNKPCSRGSTCMLII